MQGLVKGANRWRRGTEHYHFAVTKTQMYTGYETLRTTIETMSTAAFHDEGDIVNIVYIIPGELL